MKSCAQRVQIDTMKGSNEGSKSTMLIVPHRIPLKKLKLLGRHSTKGVYGEKMFELNLHLRLKAFVQGKNVSILQQ